MRSGCWSFWRGRGRDVRASVLFCGTIDATCYCFRVHAKLAIRASSSRRMPGQAPCGQKRGRSSFNLRPSDCIVRRPLRLASGRVFCYLSVEEEWLGGIQIAWNQYHAQV